MPGVFCNFRGLVHLCTIAKSANIVVFATYILPDLGAFSWLLLVSLQLITLRAGAGFLVMTAVSHRYLPANVHCCDVTNLHPSYD